MLQGFSARWTSALHEPQQCTFPCKCELFTSVEGTFSDGSEDNEYQTNADCRWVIAPPASDSKHIVLEFDSFEVKTYWAYVTINSCASLQHTSADGVPICVGPQAIADKLSGSLSGSFRMCEYYNCDSPHYNYVSATGIMEVTFSTDSYYRNKVHLYECMFMCTHTHTNMCICEYTHSHTHTHTFAIIRFVCANVFV